MREFLLDRWGKPSDECPGIFVYQSAHFFVKMSWILSVCFH